MQDVLPQDVHVWQALEEAAARVFGLYGYREIRTPILEHTEVFTRSIGETTDIVEKEMYTFEDKGGRSVTMRPEGTAPIVRAYVQNGMHNLPSPQKVFYRGPMFRYERPQKGRLRQFHQVGAEAFGAPGPDVDAEIIAMLHRFLSEVGLGGLVVELNSIGDRECRPAYREAMLDFFSDRREGLCPDCQRRYEQNPLRILDCKVPRCIELRQGAPKVSDHLCEGCREHFDGVKELLELLGVPYKLNPEMVRGLDYYTRTTFEITSSDLGSQNAVAAGGRYDGLVKEFGGQDTPAIGFAVGMERLAALMGGQSADVPEPEVFISSLGGRAAREAMRIASGFRDRGVWAEIAYGQGSLKSQMRRANKLGSHYALVIGDDELDKGVLNWKDLRGEGSGEVRIEDVYDFFPDRA
jgi:histidyl-tRNA synthetase